MNDVRACVRIEAGALLGAKLAEAFGAQARGNNGNAHGSLGIGRVRPHPRESLQTDFQRTGATGRERSRTDRTQEVAGSSPASSIPAALARYRRRAPAASIGKARERRCFVVRDQPPAVDDRAVGLDVRIAEVDVAAHDTVTPENAAGADADDPAVAQVTPLQTRD